jgi:prepilin-type processing-associated H-X9-DG protein
LGDSAVSGLPGEVGTLSYVDCGIFVLTIGNLDSAFRAAPRPSDALNKRQAFYQRRHSGRWNIVFLDGHVEFKKGQQVFDIGNPEIAKRWNNDNQPRMDVADPPDW